MELQAKVIAEKKKINMAWHNLTRESLVHGKCSEEGCKSRGRREGKEHQSLVGAQLRELIG